SWHRLYSGAIPSLRRRAGGDGGTSSAKPTQSVVRHCDRDRSNRRPPARGDVGRPSAVVRRTGFLAGIGLIVVVQNVVSSLFNSHLFDFTEGWAYVWGVGV